MADIVAIESTENLSLIAGATQHWQDPELGKGWEAATARHARGRTLIIGTVTTAHVEDAARAADEVHVLVRGIPDAARLAKTFPSTTVWCGDPADLMARTEPFDAVICLADASVALPLESESRTWEAMVADIRSLCRPDGTLVLIVENDLGVHRLSALRNPHSANEDEDWDPTATWDESRPRTLAALHERFPDAVVHCLWPTPLAVELLAQDTVAQRLHTTLATHAAASPMHGPDPAWLISSFGMSGNLGDVAPAWLVTLGAHVELPAVERVHGGHLVTGPTESPDGRSALQVFAELASAHDLPGIRRFIEAWARATGGEDGTTTTAASFGLCTAEPDGDEWVITPLSGIPETDAQEEQWRALGRLVGAARDRAWRTPWPSTTGYPRMLNHLGIMAGLHTVSSARAERLIPPLPQDDRYSDVDHQQLVAKLEQQEYSIHTLRSKLRWIELQYDKERERAATGAVATVRAMGFKAKRIGAQGGKQAKGLVKRIIG